VAVDHWDTDNPHPHIVLRGVDDAGEDLFIAREYISHGMRLRLGHRLAGCAYRTGDQLAIQMAAIRASSSEIAFRSPSCVQGLPTAPSYIIFGRNPICSP
jgi:hypothetical protein